MFLIVITAMVTGIVPANLLKFKQFCMHDFERNIKDRNFEQCLEVNQNDFITLLAPVKSTIIFFNTKTVHPKLQYQISIKFAYLCSSPERSAIAT